MDEICRYDQPAQKPFFAKGLLALVKAIADTGFIVAFKNRTDLHHTWALARQLDEPALTCKAVLSEAAFHVNSSEEVLILVASGMLQVAFDCSQNVEHLRDLAARYSDRHPDLADLCVIRMSELYPRHLVAAVDEDDFRAYRRNKRDAIPLLCPPEK